MLAIRPGVRNFSLLTELVLENILVSLIDPHHSLYGVQFTYEFIITIDKYSPKNLLRMLRRTLHRMLGTHNLCETIIDQIYYFYDNDILLQILSRLLCISAKSIQYPGRCAKNYLQSLLYFPSHTSTPIFLSSAECLEINLCIIFEPLSKFRLRRM